MNVRTLLCATLLTLLIGVTASGAAADGWPPWKPLSRGGGMSVPGGGDAAAIVIPSRKVLDRFPILTMHPGSPGCCQWYEVFDWQHDAVLLVVAHMRGEFTIYSLMRRGSTLRVTIGPRYPEQPLFAAPITLWMTVDIRKRLLGTPLPRRVVVSSEFPNVKRQRARTYRNDR